MTQKERLRNLFMSRPGQFISLTEIMDMRIAQYGRVISELRKGIDKKDKRLMDIENLTRFDKEKGMQLSWFCYHPKVEQKTFDFAEKNLTNSGS